MAEPDARTFDAFIQSQGKALRSEDKPPAGRKAGVFHFLPLLKFL